MDQLMALLSDGTRIGAIVVACWAAVRISTKASSDAIAVYRAAAADADARLAAERQAWAAEKAQLLEQIDELRDNCD